MRRCSFSIRRDTSSRIRFLHDARKSFLFSLPCFYRPQMLMAFSIKPPTLLIRKSCYEPRDVPPSETPPHRHPSIVVDWLCQAGADAGGICGGAGTLATG